MLEVVVRAALCTLLLAVVVQLALWALRVRHAKLQRFTIDRLVGMLGKLNQDVELSVNVRPRAGKPVAPAAG